MAVGMVDAACSVAKIVEVAFKINDVVDTVHRNKEVCGQIGTRVKRLTTIMSWIANSEVSKMPAMAATLKDLEGTLERAYKLVTRIKAKNIMCIYFMAGNLSRELGQVNSEIMDHIAIANFGNNIRHTIMFNKHFERGLHGMNPKDPVVIQSSDCNILTTGRSDGSDVTGENEIVANVLEAPLSKGFSMYSLSELKAATNNFSQDSLIAKGGCATVYKGVLPNRGVVAIKKFGETPLLLKCVEHYVNVFSVLLPHENIVNLLGYCHEVKQQMKFVNGKYEPFTIADIFVVVEYLPSGTLCEIIDGSSSSSKQLDWSSRFRIIRGVAVGVDYLHSKNVVHLDVKPDNIILDSDMSPKICDFEIAKILCSQSEELTEAGTSDFAGTLGYFPPEYITDGKISVKNDVYSFGVLVLCTISGMSRAGIPQNSIDWGYEVRDAGQDMDALFDSSLREDYQVNDIKRCIDIALLCTAVDKDQRPTMPRVIEMLDGKDSLLVPKRSKKIKS